MTDENMDARKRRVQRLKKMIVTSIIMAIIIPLIATIVLAVCLVSSRREMKDLKEKLSSMELAVEEAIAEKEQMRQEAEQQLALAQEISVIQEAVPEAENAAALAEESGRKVYLTFDDGPSENTEKILDILKEHGVKATFFVVAKESARYETIYQRIVDEGHTLGMHSFSHKYDEIYESLDNYQDDLMKLQQFLFDKTGVMTNYTRFPGGSSNAVSRVDIKELIQYLDEEDILYYDWNVESGDTTSGKNSAEKIVDNCMERIPYCRTAIVLMHDAADKDSTVEALPMLIESILELEDTEILPIDDTTIPIHHKTVANG